MQLNEGLKRIDDYFADISPEQLYNDLLECGLSDISSWSEAGVELANSTEAKAYTVTNGAFEFELDRSYSTYYYEQAEAA